ncbi:MAG: hypothetical protein ACYCS1_08415 [Gammaproteobacteria bacterium]
MNSASGLLQRGTASVISTPSSQASKTATSGQWLVAYWRRFGRFGSLAAMIETSLVERLQETNPQHARGDQIALDRAFAALQRIGAALVFGRVDKIGIPDPEIAIGQTKPGFALEDVLPDWSPEHRRRLLSRAAFDPATFGHVRLHNDNEGVVRAFLSAKACPAQAGELFLTRSSRPSVRRFVWHRSD